MATTKKKKSEPRPLSHTEKGRLLNALKDPNNTIRGLKERNLDAPTRKVLVELQEDLKKLYWKADKLKAKAI